MGGVVFIGGPYVPFRRAVSERDAGLLSRHQPSQPGARTLRKLSILLEGPAELLAGLLATHLPQLTGEHQSLLASQSARELPDTTHLVTQHDEPLELSANVDDLHTCLTHPAQGNRCLQRRLDGASPGKRATAIADPGLEALLENASEVQTVDKGAFSARVHHELERGLAVAVLEILPAQLVAICTEQQLTPGPRHERHLLGRIGTWPAPRNAGSVRAGPRSLELTSGRHIPMSSPTAKRPPCQSPSSPASCLGGAISGGS